MNPVLIVFPVLLAATAVIKVVAERKEPVPEPTVEPEPEPDVPEFYDNVVDFISARSRILLRRHA